MQFMCHVALYSEAYIPLLDVPLKFNKKIQVKFLLYRPRALGATFIGCGIGTDSEEFFEGNPAFIFAKISNFKKKLTRFLLLFL